MKTKGWKKIFKFTFIQNAKSKAFIISTVVISILLALLAAGINIIPALVMDSDTSDQVGQTPITKVYLCDKTGISTAESYKSISENLGVKIETISSDKLDTKLSEIKTSTGTETIVVIEKEETAYSIIMSRPESEDSISKSDCDTLIAYFKTNFEAQRLLTDGLSSDKLNDALSIVNTNTAIAGEDPVNMFDSIVKTTVPMVSSLVLFMLIFIYGQMIAQSIATEKTSRVMELLLTSVRPLAVIIGKVLAMGSLAILQFAIFIFAGGVSFAATAPIGIIGKMQQAAQMGDAMGQQITDGISKFMANINPLTIVGIIVIFVLGFLFYALIAGLIGASISRMEDLSAAMQPMAFIGVIGFYLAYFPSFSSIDGGSVSIFSLLSYYLPISSPFALPSAIMMGDMSVLQICLSIFVLAVFVALLALLVARVYEQIVLHSGNRLKVSELLNLAKKNK